MRRKGRKGLTLAELTVFMASAGVLLAAIASVEATSRRATFTEMASLRLLEDGRWVSSQLRSDLASAEAVRVGMGGERLEVDAEGGTIVYSLNKGRLVRSFLRSKHWEETVMRGQVEEFSAMIDPSFPELVRVKLKLSRSTGVRSISTEREIVVTTRARRDGT